jgi:predicted dehydrogenase
MLHRDDLDAVIVGTPMQVHAEMSIDACDAAAWSAIIRLSTTSIA